MTSFTPPAASSADNVTLPNDFSLVIIEGENSAQPSSNWSYLASFEAFGRVVCASVGWMILDDDNRQALAPNLGSINDERSAQVSGNIQIPTCCVINVTRLDEPRLTCA